VAVLLVGARVPLFHNTARVQQKRELLLIYCLRRFAAVVNRGVHCNRPPLISYVSSISSKLRVA